MPTRRRFFRTLYRCHSERSDEGAQSSNLLLFIRPVARDYDFWVYFMTNRNHTVLYLGVTNALSRRVCEHKRGAGAGFTQQFRCTKLIYYSRFRDVRDAIAREKQLKKWSRAKKVALIEAMNPRWLDLGAEVLDILELVKDSSTTLLRRSARNDNERVVLPTGVYA